MATMSKVTLEDYIKFMDEMKRIYLSLEGGYKKFVESRENLTTDFYGIYSAVENPAIQIAMLNDSYVLDTTINESPTFDSYIAKETNYINMVGAFEKAIVNGKEYKTTDINGLIVQNNFESNSNSNGYYSFKPRHLAVWEGQNNQNYQNKIYNLYKKKSLNAYNVQADSDNIVMGKIVVTAEDVSTSDSNCPYCGEETSAEIKKYTKYSASYTREVGIYNGSYNANKQYSKETIDDGTVIRYCAPSKVKFQLVDESGKTVESSDSELLTIQIKGVTLVKDRNGNINSKEITEDITFTDGKSESINYYFYVTSATVSIVLIDDQSNNKQKLNNYVIAGNFIKLTNVIETTKTQESSSLEETEQE